MVARGDLALALAEKIQLIPDGGNNAKSNGWASSSNQNNIKFDFQGQFITLSKMSINLRPVWQVIINGRDGNEKLV